MGAFGGGSKPAGGGGGGSGGRGGLQGDLVYRGEWVSGTDYAAHDVVVHNRAMFVASAAVSGSAITPDEDVAWVAQPAGSRLVMSWPTQTIDRVEEVGASVITAEIGAAGIWCHLREQARIARGGYRLYPAMGGSLSWLRVSYAFGDFDLHVYNDGGYLSYTGVNASGDWACTIGDVTGSTGAALGARKYPCITMGAGTPYTLAVDYKWSI